MLLSVETVNTGDTLTGIWLLSRAK